MIGVPKTVRLRDNAFRGWIRTLPCLLADRDPCECGGMVNVVGRRLVTEACHVKSRGAGGDDRANLVPGCSKHHMEQHRIGMKSFEKRYGLNLASTAKALWRRYLAEQFEADQTDQVA